MNDCFYFQSLTMRQEDVTSNAIEKKRKKKEKCLGCFW